MGAAIGDSVVYENGRRYGTRLRATRAGRWVGEERWAAAHSFVPARGGQAVLAGRFVGFLRALVPAVVGDVRMPYRTFLAWNVAGAVLWVPLTIGAGYLAQDAYATVADAIGAAGALAVAVALVAVLLMRRVRARRAGIDTEQLTDLDPATTKEPSCL